MKQTTKDSLFEAMLYCENEDKSTEFMIQYMQDTAKVDHDCVVKFLTEYDAEDLTNYCRRKLIDGLDYCIQECDERDLSTKETVNFIHDNTGLPLEFVRNYFQATDELRKEMLNEI